MLKKQKLRLYVDFLVDQRRYKPMEKIFKVKKACMSL